MNKIPIIAVVGPTASGKTALAVKLARHFDAEVLSFDSMQLYEGMDIATAKPTTEEMQGIPHHMIGCVPRNEVFSVALYKDAATKIIDDILSRGKRVVMVGGTGLYLDSLMENIEFLEDGNDSKKRFEVRARLESELLEHGPAYMHGVLAGIDPKTAESLHPNNTGRVLRALEIYYTTGKTMSYQVEHSKLIESRYAPIYIGLGASDRQYLYDRINQRVDLMLEGGLMNEVVDFVNEEPGATARQAIGLKELAPYVRGEDDLVTCIDRLKQETRRYAKRQLTWFRRNKAVHWLMIDVMSEDELFDAAVKIIEEEGERERSSEA